MPYRRPANLGKRCKTWQRKRGRLKCRTFKYPRRMFQMGFRPGHVPRNRGATCLRRKKVFSPWFNKKVWRCASYGGRGAPPPFGAGVRRPFGPPSPRVGGSGATVPGYIPMSMPAMERAVAGRTPPHGGYRRPLHGGRPGRKLYR
jgi:hypothetical protein